MTPPIEGLPAGMRVKRLVKMVRTPALRGHPCAFYYHAELEPIPPEEPQAELLVRRMFATRRHGQTEFHIVVSGPKGAIQFHFVTVEDRKYDHYNTFPLSSMGVEMHKAVPVEESNHHACWMLGGKPCRHDGTSLWAAEYVMPAFMAGGCEEVYPMLERQYRDRFGEDEAVEHIRAGERSVCQRCKGDKRIQVVLAGLDEDETGYVKCPECGERPDSGDVSQPAGSPTPKVELLHPGEWLIDGWIWRTSKPYFDGTWRVELERIEESPEVRAVPAEQDEPKAGG